MRAEYLANPGAYPQPVTHFRHTFPTLSPPNALEQLLAEKLRVRERAADEARMVLGKVNARRVIHAEHGNGLNSLEEEELGGFVLRLRRGELGLRRLASSDPL